MIGKAEEPVPVKKQIGQADEIGHNVRIKRCRCGELALPRHSMCQACLDLFATGLRLSDEGREVEGYVKVDRAQAESWLPYGWHMDYLTVYYRKHPRRFI